MSAGFRWTVSSQPRVLVLNKPMAFEPAPAHRKNRWAVDSLDYSAREVISIASGRMEVEATIKFEKNAQGLVDMLRDAADGNVVTYYPDLSNGTGYALWLVSDNPEISPQAGNWSLGNYEVRTRWRDASASGTSIAPLFERLLFRLDAGHFPLGYIMTRSGTVGSYRAFDGTLDSAAENIARIDWSSGSPGLLLESARTNVLTRSEDLTHGDWSATGLSARTADQAVGPDGATSLDELVENSGTSAHDVRQTRTLTADVDYALSAFAIADTRSWLRLVIYDTGTPANQVEGFFNLTTGAVGTTDDGGTASFVDAYVEDWTDVAPGLYRCVLAGSVGNSATSIGGVVGMADSDDSASYLGDGSSSLFAGYAQLELGRQASSYMATTTASVTRNADTFYAPFTAAPQEMTVYMRLVDRAADFTGTNTRGLHIGGSNGGTDPRFGIYRRDSSLGWNAFHDNGVTLAQSGSTVESEHGDTVEVRAVLGADGSVVCGAALNDGAETVGTASGAPADGLMGAWADTRLYLNSGGSGSNIGRGVYLSVKIAAGTKTMAQMRAL